MSELHAEFLGLAAPAAAAGEEEDETGKADEAANAMLLRISEQGRTMRIEVGDEAAAKSREPAKRTMQQVVEKLNDTGYRNLEYLIALVPDPLDSTLANDFDFALDALRRAFAAHGYLPDRAYLPWLGEDAEAKLYRQRPGILLFRRTDVTEERHLASVLLVGERLKTGIHADAFDTAVKMLSDREVGKAADRRLRVLGPSFSGSAESLRLALLRSKLHFEIVTGTATANGLESAFDVEQILRLRVADVGPVQPGAGGSVSFCRAILPDSVLQRAAWRFFRESLGWNLRRIALLVEEDTGYGGGAAAAGGGSAPLLVRFPSGLTEVRKLWETSRLRPEVSGATSLTGLAPQEPASELSLADSSTPADVASEFDAVTPRTKELMIANLLGHMTRYHARYVGIVATDTRDKLYLTERVRGFAPGVVLFAFENHLVQAHPRFVRPLRPVLLIGNFPTTTEHRSQHDPRGPFLRQFGGEFHQGVYSAAERLVADFSGTPDLGFPRVWITVSARESILPVASIAPALEGSGLCESMSPLIGRNDPEERSLELPRLPALGAPGYLLIALLLSALLGLAVNLEAVSPQKRTPAVTLLASLGTAALWLPATALLAVAIYPHFREELTLQWKLVVVGLWATVAILFLGLTGLFCLAAARLFVSSGHLIRQGSTRAERAGRIATALGLAAIPLVPLGLVVLLLCWICLHDPTTGYFHYLHLRARHSLSGLSPLPPLLCLGLAAWSWTRLEMQRLRQRERFRSAWPLRQGTDPALAATSTLVREVKKRTGELLPRSLKFWGVLTLALFVPVLALLRVIQPITEPQRYGRIFLALVLVPFLLATVSFLRFVRIWRRLERLLARLEQSALCAELSTVGKEVGWKPISSFGWRMPSYRLLVLSARKLKAMEEPYSVDVPRGGRVSLDDQLRDFFAAEASNGSDHWKRELTARNNLRKAFACAAARLGRGDARVAGDAFLATQLIAYLRYVFLHLRQSLIAAVSTWLFLLVAVSTYAFEPKYWVNVGLWLALAIGSIVTLWTFVQMDRNPILSRIGDGTPGQVDLRRPFIFNALTYGLAPLIAVVLSIFPELGRHLGRWTDPMLRLLGS